MGELKKMPPEYTLLKKIGEYIGEYFDSLNNLRMARSTDIYELLKHKEDFRKEFRDYESFCRFIKKMHIRDESAMRRFINYRVYETNPKFFQWYFLPKDKPMIRETTARSLATAKTGQSSGQLKYGKKKYPAANGEKVRSLEELHIINTLLEQEDFTVYYERPLVAGGKECYPDFTIHNRSTDTVFYWEHFGMSGKNFYDEGMEEKIAWYQRVGIAKIEDNGQFIATIRINDNQFVTLVDERIAMMKTIIIPTGFLRH